MSATCVFLIHNASEVDRLRASLSTSAKQYGYAVDFYPQNGFLRYNQQLLHDCDVVFTLCDSAYVKNSSLLLAYDGYHIDGMQARQPLSARLLFIEMISRLCLSHAKMVEVYLSDDNPCTSDYVVYRINVKEVAHTLEWEYNKDSVTPFLPCVHLILDK